MYGLIFLPLIIELDRVQFSRHFSVLCTDDIAKMFSCKKGVYIVLYANDILLITPSVCEVNNLLQSVER